MATATKKQSARKGTTKKASAKKATAKPKSKPKPKAKAESKRSWPTKWFTDLSGERAEVNKEGLLSACKKEFGIPIKDGENMLTLIKKDLDIEEQMEADGIDDEERRELLNEQFANLKEVVERHFEIKEEIEEEKAEAKKAKASRGHSLMLATAKGHDTSLALRDNFVEASQMAVGEKFVVTSTSLAIAEDAEVSEQEVAEAVGILANAADKLDDMRSANGWMLGDAVILLEDNFPDGEDAVAQVVKITGKQKHTVQQARRLARYFPPEERMEDLSMTHHQELFNYRDNFTTAAEKRKLKKIIAEARKGEVTEIKIPNPDDPENPEIREQTTPVSCAKLRKALQEAAGKEPEKKEEKEKGEKKTITDDENEMDLGFFYITKQAIPFWSEKFDADAAANSILVIDIKNNILVNDEGDEGDAILTLDKKNGVFPTADEDEDEAEEAEEAAEADEEESDEELTQDEIDDLQERADNIGIDTDDYETWDEVKEAVEAAEAEAEAGIDDEDEEDDDDLPE